DPGWLLVLGSAAFIWALVGFKAEPFRRIFIFLLDGVLVTSQLTIASFLFILLVGLIGGMGRIAKNPIVNGIATLYVEIMRGIPLMVQLLFMWFALPQALDLLGKALLTPIPSLGQWLIDLSFSPFVTAVTGLTVCYGAYMSEIYRAGIESIPKGQMEAARSLGMSYFQAMRYIILPQAIRVILPPVGNEFIALLKDSALVSVLAVSDLTRRGREFMARTFLSLETWAMVALIYLVLTLFLARIVAFLEKKMRFVAR
ncbi:MAG: amino acid ABC transporter permease, partial [Chloroflexota bacterium]|nr:amino acid ABC transporter permease [Chloroflexota bacterium]